MPPRLSARPSPKPIPWPTKPPPSKRDALAKRSDPLWARLLDALLPSLCFGCDLPVDTVTSRKWPLGLCLRCYGRLQRPPLACAACNRQLPTVKREGELCTACRVDPPSWSADRKSTRLNSSHAT